MCGKTGPDIGQIKPERNCEKPNGWECTVCKGAQRQVTGAKEMVPQFLCSHWFSQSSFQAWTSPYQAIFAMRGLRSLLSASADSLIYSLTVKIEVSVPLKYQAFSKQQCSYSQSMFSPSWERQSFTSIQSHRQNCSPVYFKDSRW
jgi:hypothetical protein